jgi:hypothetical protein
MPQGSCEHPCNSHTCAIWWICEYVVAAQNFAEQGYESWETEPWEGTRADIEGKCLRADIDLLHN